MRGIFSTFQIGSLSAPPDAFVSCLVAISDLLKRSESQHAPTTTKHISNTHLLHYGSDFLPFLEQLPTLRDIESSWAMKVDDTLDVSDDSDEGTLDEDEDLDGVRRHSARRRTCQSMVLSCG